MPFAAIASAVARTRVSLQSPANVFQVFQPMGGVRARPSNFPSSFSARAAVAAMAAQARRQESLFIGRGGWGPGPGRGRQGRPYCRRGGPSPARALAFSLFRQAPGGAYGSLAWISLLAAEKSISAASGLCFRAAMTFPISFRDWAPESLIASAIRASSFAASRPLGRYFSRSLISASFAATRSARPPFSNSSFASARFLTPLRTVAMTSASSIGLERSMEARWTAASAERSAVAVTESLAFTAVTMSARSCSYMVGIPLLGAKNARFATLGLPERLVPKGDDVGKLAQRRGLEKAADLGGRDLGLLVPPRYPVRHVGARSPQLEDGQDVGLDGIADHQEFRGVDAVLAEDALVGAGVFLRDDLHRREALGQARLRQLPLLVPQVPLRDQQEAVRRREEIERLPGPLEELDGVVHHLAAEGEDLAHLGGADLPLRQVDGGLDRREHVAFDPVAVQPDVAALRRKKRALDRGRVVVLREQPVVALMDLLEDVLVVP